MPASELITSPAVIESMKNAVDEKKILVSIAAGISTEYVMSAVGFPCKVVRAMPNTPLLLGYGATALSRCPSVTDSEFEEVSRGFFLLSLGNSLRKCEFY